MVKMSTRYIEIVGGVGVFTCYLVDADLKSIGEFTRENVAEFLEISSGPEERPIEDFHAVCDDMEIPWATKEGRDCYNEYKGKTR
jgi:hypothetical protein